jgi:hypothetical protein
MRPQRYPYRSRAFHRNGAYCQIDRFAEELIGFAGNLFPELSEALAGRGDSGDVKIFVNQKTGVTLTRL